MDGLGIVDFLLLHDGGLQMANFMLFACILGFWSGVMVFQWLIFCCWMIKVLELLL